MEGDIVGITAGDIHPHIGAGTPLKGWGPMRGPTRGPTPRQRNSNKQEAVEEKQ